MPNLSIKDELTEFLLYTTPNSDIKVEIYMHNETVWLPQKKIAELFDVNIPAISKHLNNIYEDGELEKEATISILEIVQKEGSRDVKRQVEYYNLDAILSVGYRVNSSKATQFRIWATKILREYIIKGFAMDDDRLKNGKYFGKDYFRELLERVRSIRASERRIYQQIIYKNADKLEPFMGLQTWKNSPVGRVLKSDTVIAKNYLSEDDINNLERAVSGYFDYIERMIEKHTTLTMEKIADSVNKFLEFNEYEILENSGKISRSEAEEKAFSEYKEFNKMQKIESDFDKEMKKILMKSSQ